MVLVADSSTAARTPCVRYLTLRGFQVMEAASGDEALSKLGRTRPNAILSGLEGNDARQLYDRLRVDDELRHVPIIVLAADDDIPLPATDATVLMKPFSLHTLLTDLRHAFRMAVGIH